MTTRFDDGPESGPDDPLAAVLRPPAEFLGPPAGRYEAVRRAAARRRLLRAAAGLGVSCAVAALVALPLHLAGPSAPASPTVPLAPPPADGRTVPPAPSPTPTPSASPVPSRPTGSVTSRPTRSRQTGGSRASDDRVVPTPDASATPTVAPSAVRSGASTPGSDPRR
ncbi:hypothetical protein [Streptomyces siamensis]|uniref:Cellulase n=1 Tax=Streptomyces siamensis TaxID=1274986 RepID=A0ABP9JP74_9ACTN